MNLIFHKKLNKFITKIYITKELVEHLEYILKKLKKDQLLVNGMNNEFTQEKMDFVEDVLFQTRIYPNPKIVGGHKTLAKVSQETEGLRDHFWAW
jgi:hypothetical protein